MSASRRRPRSWLSRLVASAYSRLAGRYDRIVTHGSLRWGVAGGRRAVAAWAEALPRGTPVLDLPTGTGEYLPHLPASTVGVDLAEGMLRRASTRSPGTPLVRADMFELPFPDASVGAVFSALGLQLLPRPRDAVGEAARVLRPDGVLHGVTPIALSPAVPTRGAVRRLLEGSGFHVEHLERRRLMVFFTARHSRDTNESP